MYKIQLFCISLELYVYNLSYSKMQVIYVLLLIYYNLFVMCQCNTCWTFVWKSPDWVALSFFLKNRKFFVSLDEGYLLAVILSCDILNGSIFQPIFLPLSKKMTLLKHCQKLVLICMLTMHVVHTNMTISRKLKLI